jgi:GDP-mannose 6-dehydrogenase
MERESLYQKRRYGLGFTKQQEHGTERRPLCHALSSLSVFLLGGSMRIAVFGLGYVGTVTAAGLASRGHQVTGVDVDPVKVSLIRDGRSPVVEPGLDELITESTRTGTLQATADAAEALDRAEVSLLCVGTPSTPRGATDLSYVRRALTDIRQALEAASPPPAGLHCVVIRSTVPPGTSDSLVSPVFDPSHLPGGWTIGTAMCPEFLREGSGVSDFFDPPFVVLGSADPRVHAVVSGMFSFLGRQVRHVDVRSAEALKYACNAFHATKVSFTNEMSRIFRAFDIDSRDVMEIFCEDRVLNISPAYLRPGFAFGGSCLPKDIRALLHMARVNALDAPLLTGALRTNELLVRDVADRVLAGGSRSVALLGLSFKMDTDDLRESPHVELAELLIGKGMDVRIYDPIVNPERLMGANLRSVEARLPHLRRVLVSTPATALSGSDTAVVGTCDPQVIHALHRTRPERVIDLNGRLGPDIESLPGYEGVGWAV